MPGHNVFVLRLKSLDRLESAFKLVMDSAGVSSCIIEPDTLHIRFLAAGDAARLLMERIYLEGGLVWSSRHALSTDPPRT